MSSKKEPVLEMSKKEPVLEMCHPSDTKYSVWKEPVLEKKANEGIDIGFAIRGTLAFPSRCASPHERDGVLVTSVPFIQAEDSP